jgi:hypothetical protein
MNLVPISGAVAGFPARIESMPFRDARSVGNKVRSRVQKSHSDPAVPADLNFEEPTAIQVTTTAMLMTKIASTAAEAFGTLQERTARKREVAGSRSKRLPAHRFKPGTFAIFE